MSSSSMSRPTLRRWLAKWRESLVTVERARLRDVAGRASTPYRGAEKKSNGSGEASATKYSHRRAACGTEASRRPTALLSRNIGRMSDDGDRALPRGTFALEDRARCPRFRAHSQAWRARLLSFLWGQPGGNSVKMHRDFLLVYSISGSDCY